MRHSAKVIPKALLLSFLIIQIAASIDMVASQVNEENHPTDFSTIEDTTHYSGGLSDVESSDDSYMTFQSYATSFSSMSLYAHQDTTLVGEDSYYVSMLQSADGEGENISVSMVSEGGVENISVSTASTGRKLFGKFLYPLNDVAAIPESNWTFHYRTWYSNLTRTVVTRSPSSTTGVWGTPENAYSPDDTYATTPLDLAVQRYGSYGIALPDEAFIIKVEVGYEAYTTGDERIGVALSWSGGSNWTDPVFSGPLKTTDQDILTWLDFTNVTHWNAKKLSDTRFSVAAVSIILGSPSNILLDWLPVRVTYLKSLPLAHVNVDILIRKSDGSIRRELSVAVANSTDITGIPQTLQASYYWSNYEAIDETDYLEIDYYIDYTTRINGTAFLAIDHRNLPVEDQTSLSGIILPDEHSIEVIFEGSCSSLDNWANIVWTIESAWTTPNVSVTLQLYNYALEDYSAGVNGYIAYLSNETPYTDEAKNQTIMANPEDFRDGLGRWKIKIKGVKSTTSGFTVKVDEVTFEVGYLMSDIAVLNVTTSSTSVIPGETVLINATVENEGETVETFNVTAHCNDTQIEEERIFNLLPSGITTIVFDWDTSDFASGKYTIRVVADTVLHETDISDNTHEESEVTVKSYPAALFNYKPEIPTVGHLIVFNASLSCDSDGVIVDYSWNLDDGATSNGITTSYNYSSVGTYNITLAVTDNDNLTNSIWQALTVHVRDLAILEVSSSTAQARAGDLVNITVVVKNKGTLQEAFNVTLYSGDMPISKRVVFGLAPESTVNLTFNWDTTEVLPANYTLKAIVDNAEGESDVSDNMLSLATTIQILEPAGAIAGFPRPLQYLLPIGLVALGVAVGVTWKKKRGASKLRDFGFFDEIVGGGIFVGSSLLVKGSSSSGKSLLCQQLAKKFLSENKACVYVTYDNLPSKVRESIEWLGWNHPDQKQEENLVFVDCYSPIAQSRSEERFSVEPPYALTELSIVTSTALSQISGKPKALILDSATSLFTNVDPKLVIQFLQNRAAKMKAENGVFVFSVGEGTLQPRLINKLEEVADGVVELDIDEGGKRDLKRMRIKKMSGQSSYNDWVNFKLGEGKGIVFLEPKKFR